HRSGSPRPPQRLRMMGPFGRSRKGIQRGQHVPQELKLPEVGEGIETGTVVALLVKEGDRIEVDQPVLELETDKAVVEVPSTVAGVVTKVHLEANTEARIGQVMITVDPQGASE